MTQRIFDIKNEKDMADLWDILPEEVYKIKKEEHNCFNALMYFSDGHSIRPYIKINWHDKTEIIRPIQEATEVDIGKLCEFWDYPLERTKYKLIGVLTYIKDHNEGFDFKYCLADSINFEHCRRLTKQEIEELC